MLSVFVRIKSVPFVVEHTYFYTTLLAYLPSLIICGYCLPKPLHAMPYRTADSLSQLISLIIPFHIHLSAHHGRTYAHTKRATKVIKDNPRTWVAAVICHCVCGL
jgi:hypothetical protein